jgi:hypothetical protein
VKRSRPDGCSRKEGNTRVVVLVEEPEGLLALNPERAVTAAPPAGGGAGTSDLAGILGLLKS